MTRPQYRPEHRMLNDAIIDAAGRHPSSAPQWIANAMLDAYGEQHATTIADSLPRMIRAEHAARVRGAAIRACADPLPRPAPDQIAASYEVDPVPPFDGWRAVRIERYVVVAAIFAALAWGVLTVAWAQHTGARAQAEQGAVEW